MSGAWLAPSRAATSAQVRLFCLPYAGGGSGLFRTWSKVLPDEIEVCPLQLPGRERRLSEAAFDEIDALVTSASAELAAATQRPFAFYGHSMGAIIAFELSRRLRDEHGVEPCWLFVGAHQAPHLPDLDPPIHHLPDDEFVAAVQRYGGIPSAVLESDELMALMLPTLRADLTLAETYSYREGAPLSCPISVFGGLEDPWTESTSLRAWGEHTTATSLLRELPGGHFFVEDSRELFLLTVQRDLMSVI